MLLNFVVIFGVPLQHRAQFVLQNCCKFFGGFFQESTSGVNVTNMQVQVFLRWACVAAVFAHVKFISPLFVGVLLLHAMNLLKVRLQGTALGEGFVANLTFVRTNSCNVKRQR